MSTVQVGYKLSETSTYVPLRLVWRVCVYGCVCMCALSVVCLQWPPGEWQHPYTVGGGQGGEVRT